MQIKKKAAILREYKVGNNAHIANFVYLWKTWVVYFDYDGSAKNCTSQDTFYWYPIFCGREPKWYELFKKIGIFSLTVILENTAQEELKNLDLITLMSLIER